MKSLQAIPFPLKSPTVTAGGSDVVTLDTLPNQIFGGIAHVIGFLFRCRITPTFTTAPTVFGLQNLVSRLTFNNGLNNAFDGSFNSLRIHEVLENGKVLCPDPDTNSGTGNGFYFERYLSIGPSNFAGSPSDFMLPAAAMKNGNIQFQFGALTSISADTTAYTGAIEVIALLAPMDEIRIAPAHERNSYTFGAAEYTVQGRALYCDVGLQSGSLTTVTAITAGQIGNVSVDTGRGAVSAVSAQALTGFSRYLLASGDITQLQGEPAAATDDNANEVNSGTPTALQSTAANIQPVIVSPLDSRITKLSYLSEAGLRLRWSGSLTSGLVHVGRIVAQPDTARAALAAKALAELRMNPRGLKAKVLKGDGMQSGPRADFMPYSVKVG